MNMNEKYDDIINMPHKISNKYPHMPLETRAAQFAPFEALTGHEETVEETVRLKQETIEKNENSYELFLG